MILSDRQKSIIVNAMRVAAEAYSMDAMLMKQTKSGERLGAAFQLQHSETLALLEDLENHDTVTLSTDRG